MKRAILNNKDQRSFMYKKIFSISKLYTFNDKKIFILKNLWITAKSLSYRYILYEKNRYAK